MESVEDVVEDEPLSHAHDAKLVLLPEPDDEAPVRRLVAPPPRRPVPADASGLEGSIINQVLSGEWGVTRTVRKAMAPGASAGAWLLLMLLLVLLVVMAGDRPLSRKPARSTWRLDSAQSSAMRWCGA